VKEASEGGGFLDLEFLHEIGKSASSDPLPRVLARIVHFISHAVNSDSCFVYLVDDRQLVLRASQNPHRDSVDQLSIGFDQGITGWVAEHKRHVALPRKSYEDRRFKAFGELPEDRYEAFLSVPLMSRGKLIGVINVQHRKPYFHSRRDIHLISIIGYLVGAEIEIARLEAANKKSQK
jgi:signal transduction protein with GAF and PtsI domain